MRKGPTLEWFESYEICKGLDGRMGIYARGYNVRLATFNHNTAQLQTRLKLLFDRANTPQPSAALQTRQKMAMDRATRRKGK